jgi:hypothetical protein
MEKLNYNNEASGVEFLIYRASIIELNPEGYCIIAKDRSQMLPQK